MGTLGIRHVGADDQHVVDHDDRHDDAERGAHDPALRSRASDGSRTGTAAGGGCANRCVHRRLSHRLARVRRGGCRAALRTRTRRSSLNNDDGITQPLVVRRCADRRRAVSAFAAEECLPGPMPGAGDVSCPALASACLGCATARRQTWRVLCRLLLAVDGPVVRGWGDEPDLDRSPCDRGDDREGTSPGPMDWPSRRPRADRMGCRHAGGLIRYAVETRMPLRYRRREQTGRARPRLAHLSRADTDYLLISTLANIVAPCKLTRYSKPSPPAHAGRFSPTCPRPG